MEVNANNPMQMLIGNTVDIIVSIVRTSEGRKVNEIKKVLGYDRVNQKYRLEEVM